MSCRVIHRDLLKINDICLALRVTTSLGINRFLYVSAVREMISFMLQEGMKLVGQWKTSVADERDNVRSV
jgi:hypothetical protein